MGVRIRKGGRMFCAALSEKEDGDFLIDDALLTILATEKHFLVTTENDVHMSTGGEWWWNNEVPEGVKIDEWWKD